MQGPCKAVLAQLGTGKTAPSLSSSLVRLGSAALPLRVQDLLVRCFFCGKGAVGFVPRGPLAGWSVGFSLPGPSFSGLAADDLVAGQGPAVVLRFAEGSLADARRSPRACRWVRDPFGLGQVHHRGLSSAASLPMTLWPGRGQPSFSDSPRGRSPMRAVPRELADGSATHSVWGRFTQ